MAFTYFKGDKAEYTGQVLTIHGGTFYEVRMVEGIHKGSLKVVTNAPKAEGSHDYANTETAYGRTVNHGFSIKVF